MVGKISLAVAWIATVISGQHVCYILSATASLFAITYWLIKIIKEVKTKK